MLLENTEPGKGIDFQKQAGPSTSPLSENCMTPALLSDKENNVEIVTSLDPILNPVNRSLLSELLVHPNCAEKKTEAEKYVAHVLTSAESIALLEEKGKRN